MSIKTALQKFIGTEPATVEIPRTASAIARLTPEDMRGLLLQLLPDPVSGRPGPVRIMSPFEAETELREEMQRMVDQLGEAHKRNEEMAGRLAEWEQSTTISFVQRMRRDLEEARTQRDFLQREVDALKLEIEHLKFQKEHRNG